MSVIQEALKKAEKESIVRVEKKFVKVPESVYEPAPKPKAVQKYLSRSFLIVLFCGLAVLSGIAYFIINPSPRPADIAVIEEILPVKADIAIGDISVDTQPPPAAAIFENTYSYSNKKTETPLLSGIMYSGEKPFAVINNVMIKEGEKIGDVRVVKIDTSSVDVETKGSVLTLRLNR